MMKRAFLFFALVLALYNSYGQNYASPTYLPPSPIAQAFKLYGDIPVSYSTGVPDVSIPIYTIEAGGYSFPITLRYHLKSLKPSGCKTNVALGWTLDYGGMLSRTIYDRPDESSGSLETYFNNGSGTGSSEELKNLAKVIDGSGNSPDSEYDIYNYNLNSGEGGEFIITAYSSYLGNTYTQLSRKSVKIANGTGTGSSSYDITTDKGVLYKFGGSGNEHKSYYPGSSTTSGYPSSWLLSQVVFPNNRNINFTYEDIPGFWTRDNARNILTIFHDDRRQNSATGGIFGGPPCSPGDMPQNSVVGSSSGEAYYVEKNIKEINFPNGKIVFTLNSDKKLITGVKVYSLGNLVQEYQFVLSSGLAMGEMKFLDKIVVKDKNASTVNEYNFQYTNPTYNSIDKNATVDYWGYYNNAANAAYRGFPNGQYTYTTYNPVSGGQQTGSWTIGGGQSKAATSDCMTNTLKKIIYPTKGETEFVYELNQLSATVFGDGPRIQKIINRDGNNNTITKSYLYEIPPDQYIPDAEDFSSVNFDITICTEGGDDKKVTRTTTRRYDADITSRAAASLLECHYNKVTEFIGDFFTDIGRNVYYFQHNKHIPGPNYSPAKGPAFAFFRYRGWGNDLLYKKETYKKDELTTPSTVDNYTYVYHEDYPGYKNSVITKLTDYPFIEQGGDPDPYADNDIYQRQVILNNPQYQANETLAPDVYFYDTYYIMTGWVELQNESHLENTPNGTIVNSTQYAYNGAQQYFPSSVSTYKSDGSKSVVDKTYPYDYGATEPYHTMTTRNIIAPTIQQTLSKQAGTSAPVLLKANKTNYQDWGNNIIQPVTIQEATGTTALSNLETRIQFDSYDDNGNVTAAAKAHDVQKVFLWGYNKSYLVAEITGASLNNVLATPGLNTTIIENATGAYSDAQVRAELNKIRSYWSSAQVITNTYNPLIGITSQTDINGRTVYYEYDAFNRLSIIRDKDNNIIRKICYNYAGQVENCDGALFRSIAKSGVFYKNDCLAGTGSEVTYTVAAGAYSSGVSQQAADQLAQNDVNVNGQNYANNNGICSSYLMYSNNSSSTIYIEVSNGSQTYSTFISPSGSGTLPLPAQGNYDVTVNSSGYSQVSFEVNGYTYYGWATTFYGVYMSSSNYAQFND